MRLCVLCASFNRSRTTVEGLAALSDALNLVPGLEYSIYLLDDASTDGTAEAVGRMLPWVHIVQGTGALYWNRGMIAAFAAAQSVSHWDAYLLFNDDTRVIASSVVDLFASYAYENLRAPTVFVGQLVDPVSRSPTYGGYLRASACHPLRLRPAVSSPPYSECDTFNGNFVLVPSSCYHLSGGLCSGYWHSYGDIDLGYALKRAGASLMLFSTPVGTGRRNAPADVATLAKRWRQMFAAPQSARQVYTFYRRNGCRTFWPLFFLAAVFKRFVFVLRPQR